MRRTSLQEAWIAWGRACGSRRSGGRSAGTSLCGRRVRAHRSTAIVTLQRLSLNASLRLLLTLHVCGQVLNVPQGIVDRAGGTVDDAQTFVAHLVARAAGKPLPTKEALAEAEHCSAVVIAMKGCMWQGWPSACSCLQGACTCCACLPSCRWRVEVFVCKICVCLLAGKAREKWLASFTLDAN
jgi:hypothetical protein